MTAEIMVMLQDFKDNEEKYGWTTLSHWFAYREGYLIAKARYKALKLATMKAAVKPVKRSKTKRR